MNVSYNAQGEMLDNNPDYIRGIEQSDGDDIDEEEGLNEGLTLLSLIVLIALDQCPSHLDI